MIASLSRDYLKAPMTIKLREFQEEALLSVITEHQEGIKRQLIHLPTGSGKTIVMSAIAKHFGKKTLIIAHREELINQAVEKFRLFWPSVDIGVCKAERNEIEPQVVVGSVQSCCRSNRLEQLKKKEFDLLLIDECHHSTADSYKTIINELGFNDNPSKLLIGVTATAMRDGLGEIFEKIVFTRSISTMIKSGYLSPVVGRRILTNFNLQKLSTRNGDYDLGDLSEAVDTEERNAFVVQKFIEHANNRKGIAFCVDVDHCIRLSEAFRSHGIESQAVYGAMPSDERKRALESLKNGRIQVATSCGVLTEGFDEPSIDVILMVRPTKSEILYTQCVGRGLRKHVGKSDCMVLDFTDRGLNLDSALTLNKMIPEATVEEEEIEGIAEGEKIDRRPRIRTTESSDLPFDILGQTRFCWVDIGEGEWSLLDDDKIEIVLTPKGDGYCSTVHYPDGNSKEIVSSSLPLEYAQGVSEDFARQHLNVKYADLSTEWMQNHYEPTKGQRSYLETQGAYIEGMSKAQAAIEIRRIVGIKNKRRRQMAAEPITQKQKLVLIRAGIETTNVSKYQAMQLISKLKQHEIENARK